MPSVYRRDGSPFWWVAVGPRNDRRVFSSNTRDEETARMIAHEAEKLLALQRFGIAPPDALDFVQKKTLALETLLNEWADTLPDTRYGTEVESLARAFVKEYRLKQAGELDGLSPCEKMRKWMDLAPSNRRANQRLRFLVLFVEWLRERGFVRDPRILFIQRKAEKNDDRKVTHRALTPSEACRLIALPDRGLWYRFLLFTGFRNAEAKRLIRADFDLSDDPFIQVQREVAKNRLACRHPLARSLSAALAEHRGTIAPNRKMFEGIPEKSFAKKLLKRDLHDTGIDGKHINGRSFRMTFVTWLQAAVVDQYTVQRLRRDKGQGSDALTAWTYSDDAQTRNVLRAGIDRLDHWFASESRTKERTA